MRGRLGRIFNESNIQDLSPPVKSDSDLLVSLSYMYLLQWLHYFSQMLTLLPLGVFVYHPSQTVGHHYRIDLMQWRNHAAIWGELKKKFKKLIHTFCTRSEKDWPMNNLLLTSCRGCHTKMTLSAMVYSQALCHMIKFVEDIFHMYFVLVLPPVLILVF